MTLVMGTLIINKLQLDTPVLFLVFNRPDTTKRVFNEIRKAKPSKLYIAADGPRKAKVGEIDQVSLVREIATNVDWQCEVRTLFREENLGCKMAVSSAITWFFEHEEQGIILEDDCLPSQSFFSFCQELLEKYRHDTRVMAISGDNFQDGRTSRNYSYYFSRYSHVWGWASWRRAWQLYDRNISTWPEVKENGFLSDISGNDEAFIQFWQNIFDKTYAGMIDTWDFQWLYTCWVQSGLVVLPNVNLVSNIGFGEDATHTFQTNSTAAGLTALDIDFPLKHPLLLIRNSIADKYTEKNQFKISIKERQNLLISILVRIKKSLNIIFSTH